jgi:hypothetical protein
MHVQLNAGGLCKDHAGVCVLLLLIIVTTSSQTFDTAQDKMLFAILGCTRMSGVKKNECSYKCPVNNIFKMIQLAVIKGLQYSSELQINHIWI